MIVYAHRLATTRGLGVRWFVGALAALLGFAVQAQAATFTVGSAADTNVCPSPPAGTNCTLRQLVNSVPAGSTIVVNFRPAPHAIFHSPAGARQCGSVSTWTSSTRANLPEGSASTMTSR